MVPGAEKKLGAELDALGERMQRRKDELQVAAR
jgi:hypothetical protein